MKIAIVHDFLFEYAGSERVVEQMLKIYPEADLFSLFDFILPGQRAFLNGKRAQTSFLQHIPGLDNHTAKLLPLVVPLMPLAVEQFDLNGYDLVLSSSHSVAKGVLTGPGQLHISYIHAPMRYAWDRQADYLREGILARWPFKWIARILFSYLRLWDARTANGVDAFLANSQFVSRRIWKVYRRESEVVYPPVELSGFDLEENKGDTYLVVSRLVPYKRVDLIIQSFQRMPDRKLVIIGSGPEMGRYRRMATPNITLSGYQTDEILRNTMQRAKALIVAAVEDFGIATLEAQACGTPVIGLGQGGTLETVMGLGQESPTGVFFESQNVEELCQGVERFEKVRGSIRPQDCRQNALFFSTEHFRSAYQEAIDRTVYSYRPSLMPDLLLPIHKDSLHD